MRLVSLSQLNFRNLRFDCLTFQSGIVAVVGSNAAGKSNLLAAAYLGSTATLASGSVAEMLTWGQDEAYVAAEIEHQDGVSRVQVGLSTGQRRVRLDSQTARVHEVAQQVSAVLLTPEDSDLVHGPPALRRDYLDSLLSKLSARYTLMLREYQRVLEQRNALLRTRPHDDSLPDWTARFVELGTELTSLRRRVLARLNPLAAAAYADISGTVQVLDVSLRVSHGEAPLAEAVAERAREEAARGMTLVGPHRDDLDLNLDGHPLRSFGSRGEARTAATALRVSEYRLLNDRHGEPPVLLIDDFTAELDAGRREYLLRLAADTPQAIVSGTEPPPRWDQLIRLEGGAPHVA